jgi:hypothetical protein
MSSEGKGDSPNAPGRLAIGEWFWRFLAAAMLLSVGWVAWIAYQLNPAPLVTDLALQAAAKARASRSAGGLITPAPQAVTPAATAPAAPQRPAPPVNVERLKLSDSIGSAIPGRAKNP